MNSMKRAAIRLLGRFSRSQRGNVALIAGIALPVLLMISAGAIDLHHAAKVKSELQDALDAATLAVARSSASEPDKIQSIGMSSLRANMPQYFKTDGSDVASFTLDSKYRVQSAATVQVKTIIANVFLPPYGKLFDDYLPMSAASEVLRASRNLEVAIALDVTGSMATPRNYMPALIDAAKELVGIVVQGDQALFTTKVALVPYAAGVNMGTQANRLRGNLIGSSAITDISRLGPSRRVTTISSTRVMTLTDHGLQNGDTVYATGFRSQSGVNDRTLSVRRVDKDRFTMDGTSSTNFGSTMGSIQKCHTTGCDMVITANNHQLQNNERVQIAGAPSSVGVNTPAPSTNRGTITAYNNQAITYIDANRFSVPSSAAMTASWNSSSAGSSRPTVACGRDGCSTRIFTNMNNTVWNLDSTTCVSERPRGSNAPSDRSVDSGGLLGRVYINNTCPSSPFVPLTNTLSDLNKAIEDLRAGGSTAGQVGVEMAWYAISHNFGAIGGVTPLPVNTQETVKAVVIMTDGEFNIPFCQGVIAKDSLTDGSGSNNDKINCNASNGNAFTQAYETCQAMKKQGIVVYSVAFNLQKTSIRGAVDSAYEVMHFCATDPNENFFEVNDGTDLKEAFKQIGRDITRLRIAR